MRGLNHETVSPRRALDAGRHVIFHPCGDSACKDCLELWQEHEERNSTGLVCVICDEEVKFVTEVNGFIVDVGY